MSPPAEIDPTLAAILDLARWAPSGDNTQPWRFEVRGPRQLRIHGYDTRAHCVYDLDGRPSQIALGALIETIHLAAGWHALKAKIERLPGYPESQPTFEATLSPTTEAAESRLVKQIPRRSVYRFNMSTQALTAAQKAAIESVLPAGYTICWYETLADRSRIAALLFRNAHLRLTIEEAFEVHRSVIDWNQRFSDDRLPDQALGADAVTLKIMRWAMRDWGRVQFMNRWLAGTWMPRLTLDLIPSLRCAAHFCLVADQPPTTVDDYVEAGRAVQRIWLAMTDQGLKHQPALTPLVFARYTRQGLEKFSKAEHAWRSAQQLHRLLEQLVKPLPTDRLVWMGRVGKPLTQVIARSLRRPQKQEAHR